jgi:hypothetical protein
MPVIVGETKGTKLSLKSQKTKIPLLLLAREPEKASLFSDAIIM